MKTGVLTIALVFALAAALTAASVSAATTIISTNISTGGTLSVIGASTLTGAVTAAAGLTATTGGVTVIDGGLTVTAGGATVTAGGLTVAAGGADITGNSTVTGTVTVGADGTGSNVIFYSAAQGDNFTWNASEVQLVITGTNDATALNVADGNVVIADNLTVSGTFSPAITSVSGTFTIGADHALDVAAVGQLNIGTTTATSILIGGSGTTTTVAGPLTANELATFGASASITGNLSTAGSIWVNGNATTTAAGAILSQAHIAAGGGYGDAGSVLADNGDVLMNGNLVVDGTSTLSDGASTTNASLSGELWVGGNATTTAAGNISTQGSVTATSFISADGGLTVGMNGSPQSETLFGYCTIASGTTVNASSTEYLDCANATDSVGASPVDNTFRVFVQATSSMPADFVITAASSTAVSGTIQVQVLNTGMLGGNRDPGTVSLNFWAVK